MNNKIFLFFKLAFALIPVIIVSCTKDTLKAIQNVSPFPAPTINPSFVEEFDTVGNLPAKGWVFRNNSNPAGSTGWRQGVYEVNSITSAKFYAPVGFVGFPAFSAHATPNDFASCDVSAGNDQLTGTANYSVWLISPKLPLKDGDQVTFYTRAVDDSLYPVYIKDRMQVWANFTDDSPDVGNADSTFGNFTSLLLDINPHYIYNDSLGNNNGMPGGLPGYPRAWTKVIITLSGLPNGAVASGRFAFRYFAKDAGLYGGTTGDNYPSVVGIDQLSFISN